MRLISDRAGWWLVGAHAALAVAWLVMMPGGFPVGQARFAVNRVLPIALIGVCLVSGIAAWRGDRRLLRGTVLLLAAFWTAMAGACLVLYPVSGWRLVPGALLIAGFAWLAGFSGPLRMAKLARRWLAAVAGLGVVVRVFAAVSQRAPVASTVPLGEPLPKVTAAEMRGGSIAVGPGVVVMTGTGEVQLQRSHYAISVSPLLTFSSRSPDRCWTNLAPAKERVGPARVLRGWERSADGWVSVTYADDERSVLQVRTTEAGEVELCAWSSVPQDVYSHLNSYTLVMLAGHRKMELAFSPCGREGVTPRYMEYPVGEPARSAAMFADGRFEVVEASSAEKGPFRPLLAGRIGRAEPLTVRVRDEGKDVLEITWADFAAQASTDLSPTAGYGLPVNAIEFSLSGKEPISPVGMYVTLAGTSVGRGWDSVGHRAGVYRNRMHLRWLVAERPTTSPE